MAKPMTVTDAEFEKKVLSSSQPVVVDFWAEWCGPCRAVAPILEELAGEYEGTMTIAKLDIDANPAWAQRLGVMAIPTMIVFKDGKEIRRIQGARPKRMLKAEFDAALTR